MAEERVAIALAILASIYYGLGAVPKRNWVQASAMQSLLPALNSTCFHSSSQEDADDFASINFHGLCKSKITT